MFPKTIIKRIINKISLLKQTSIVAFGVKVKLIDAVSPGSILRKAFNNRKGPSIFNKVLCNYLKFLIIININ